jgi:hypothetical protein
MAFGINKLKELGNNQIINGAERLNNHLKSFNDDIRTLQEAFNCNTKVIIKKLSVIEEKLDKILEQEKQ